MTIQQIAVPITSTLGAPRSLYVFGYSFFECLWNPLGPYNPTLRHVHANPITQKHAPIMARMSGRNVDVLKALGQYDAKHCFSRGRLSCLIAMAPYANDRADSTIQSTMCALLSVSAKMIPLLIICTVAITWVAAMRNRWSKVRSSKMMRLPTSCAKKVAYSTPQILYKAWNKIVQPNYISKFLWNKPHGTPRTCDVRCPSKACTWSPWSPRSKWSARALRLLPVVNRKLTLTALRYWRMHLLQAQWHLD